MRTLHVIVLHVIGNWDFRLRQHGKNLTIKQLITKP